MLLLDEPGNDLDTDMLAVMEDLLDNWPGTLLLVSHDRYLTERVTDNQYALLDGSLHHMPGGVDQYLKAPGVAGRVAGGEGELPGRAKKGAVVKSQKTGMGGTPKKTTAAEDPGAAKSAAARRFKNRKLLASLERKMSTLQNKLEALTEQMHETDPSDYAELIRLGELDKTLKHELRAVEDEWLELSED
ncbi:MAG TPA: hypothetical protein DEB24_06960 [Coriobacteriia bacterium]|nr:hypothetical protein [Coriobacteriia bacterium]